jgi:hypothetical protein
MSGTIRDVKFNNRVLASFRFQIVLPPVQQSSQPKPCQSQKCPINPAHMQELSSCQLMTVPDIPKRGYPFTDKPLLSLILDNILKPNIQYFAPNFH